MNYTIVIPARYASTRLPGKPLLDIGGLPMVQRVWNQARASRAQRVLVATDDPRIADCVLGFGGEVCMTRADHATGTDRLAEVAQQLKLPADAVLVNLQGDEPLLPPALLDDVASALYEHPLAGIATLCEPLAGGPALADPNVVKVVRDAQGYALYFSRAPIPWDRERFAGMAPGAVAALTEGWYRHVGLYAYRAGLLADFVRWSPAPLERLEMLEQLRALHNGVRIHVGVAHCEVPGGVDTPEDLARLRRYFAAQVTAPHSTS